MSDPPDTETPSSCRHELGETPVVGVDGSLYCCFWCMALDRAAAELRLLLRRADAWEAEQAEKRKLNGRALGAAMLNGAKK
jgi:hypothetical protein